MKVHAVITTLRATVKISLLIVLFGLIILADLHYNHIERLSNREASVNKRPPEEDTVCSFDSRCYREVCEQATV